MNSCKSVCNPRKPLIQNRENIYKDETNICVRCRRTIKMNKRATLVHIDGVLTNKEDQVGRDATNQTENSSHNNVVLVLCGVNKTFSV